MTEQNLDQTDFEAQYSKAQAAAIASNWTEPRAVAAYYDEKAGVITVRLRSGATFSFPSKIAQGLSDAGAAELSQVEVTPGGDGLHWEVLDADLTVSGLLAGVFGTKRWMKQLQQKWEREIHEYSAS